MIVMGGGGGQFMRTTVKLPRHILLYQFTRRLCLGRNDGHPTPFDTTIACDLKTYIKKAAYVQTLQSVLSYVKLTVI
jgi:hypothetical protein